VNVETIENSDETETKNVDKTKFSESPNQTYVVGKERTKERRTENEKHDK